MPVFVYRCRHCQHCEPVPATVPSDSAPRSDHCARCGGPIELDREKTRRLPAEMEPRTIVDRLHIRNALLVMAETWYAWRTSRSMLDWYRRVRTEEPELTGRALYSRILIRRSGLNITAARRTVRQAEESFCSWPAWHELRYRDVVLFVVIHEYLRSHEESLGTQTRMAATVTRVIPEDLEDYATS